MKYLYYKCFVVTSNSNEERCNSTDGALTFMADTERMVMYLVNILREPNSKIHFIQGTYFVSPIRTS